jgi:hypothetical protein
MHLSTVFGGDCGDGLDGAARAAPVYLMAVVVGAAPSARRQRWRPPGLSRGGDGSGGRPWILAPAEIRRCVGFWPYGDAVGGLCGADLRNSVELHPATSWEGAVAGENRAPTPIMADDGSVYAPSPC